MAQRAQVDGVAQQLETRHLGMYHGATAGSGLGAEHAGPP